MLIAVHFLFQKVGIRTEASKRTTEETMKLIKGAAHVEDKK